MLQLLQKQLQEKHLIIKLYIYFFPHFLHHLKKRMEINKMVIISLSYKTIKLIKVWNNLWSIVSQEFFSFFCSQSFDTLKIVLLGLIAFSVGTAGGVLFGKLMYVVTKGKVNPLIGSAGVSAVPMAARVSQKVGQEENPSNFLLMHAMGPNVSGVIGSAVAAGVLLAMIPHWFNALTHNIKPEKSLVFERSLPLCSLCAHSQYKNGKKFGLWAHFTALLVRLTQSKASLSKRQNASQIPALFSHF